MYRCSNGSVVALCGTRVLEVSHCFDGTAVVRSVAGYRLQSLVGTVPDEFTLATGECRDVGVGPFVERGEVL